MKLGQVYFRRGEWLNAETQFERLEHDLPASPMAEAALFLAGQSALKTMNTDKALDNFGKVVKLIGPLQLYARQQQAIITSSSNEGDAIKLYDDILGAKPDAELKFASLGGQGGISTLSCSRHQGSEVLRPGDCDLQRAGDPARRDLLLAQPGAVWKGKVL